MSGASFRASVGLAVALAAGCSRRDPPPPPPEPPPLQVDRDLLESAMHECFTVDCDRAHERAAQIAADSPLRATDDFRAIEFRHQVNRLLSAEGEGELDKRRALLDRLQTDPSMDEGLRMAASRALSRLGGGKTFELPLEGPRDGGASDAGSRRVVELLRTRRPEDYQAARAILEPLLYEGRATAEDVRALTVVCAAQKDVACQKTLQTYKVK